MAAANMKAVKLRIKSVQNTMQITKAMQLVAASKLRKAKDKAMASKPYLRTMKRTLTKIANENTDFQSIFTKPGTSEKRLYVVIAGDRGLAGGYNANLFKFLEKTVEGSNYAVLPIGKKAVEYFRHKNVERSRSRTASAWQSQCVKPLKRAGSAMCPCATPTLFP